MTRLAAWLTAGLLGGGLLGVLRTREAALALLEKNRALTALNIVALPGPSELETLASWQPALAGGLFFALTLGVGFASLCYLWGRLCLVLSSRWKPAFTLALLSLGAPLWAGVSGDFGLALFLSFIAIAATGVSLMGEPPEPREMLRATVAAGLLFAALLPFAIAEEGAFIRIRNQLLLPTTAGQAINDFYYQWTLYPAQVIKPLAAHTQPMIAVDTSVARNRADAFCRNLQNQRLLCVDDPTPGADGRLISDEEGYALTHGDFLTPLASPLQRDDQKAWKEFSTQTDPSGPLRTATLYALIFGLPFALCLLLLSLAGDAAQRVANPHRGEQLRWGMIAAFSLLLFLAGLPHGRVESYNELRTDETIDIETIRAALADEDPVLRHYGALAASERSGLFEKELLVALTDPVINVRYAAALALDPEQPPSRKRLIALLNSSEQWYVKERAYAALWRAGWRPR